VSKFKKGDLIRCRRTHDKGLILDTHLPSGTPKVLWVAVEELLRREFPEIGEFELTVDCKGLTDEITLKVESCEEMSSDVMAGLSARLSERLKIKTNLRFNIDCVEMGELERYTLKSKRFKDLRKTKQNER
jgi:phenylacetate-coenzyme A ligase PaaK-like adenylate-forming protein